VNAILEGERNPLALAKLRNERIQASEEVIAKSQVGDYRPEHLFTLQQSLTAYRSYQTLIEDCDREVRRALQQFHPPDPPQASAHDTAPASPRTKTRSSDGVLRAELNRAFGVDLTQIPGMNKHRHRTNPFWRDRPGLHQVPERFRICLLDGLCPDNEISGGRVLWGERAR
jgi:transposase